MLRDIIIASVRQDGPMPFEEFMRVALYDEAGGFFSSALRSTKEGDFLTSPEVSPWFGRILGRQVASECRRARGAERCTVVEAGAGSGSLLRTLVEELPQGVETWVVERSGPAMKALEAVVQSERIVRSLDELPMAMTGVILANELLDNLPTSLAVRADHEWEERWVGISDGALALEAAPARDDVIAWCDRFAGTVPVGGMVEVQLAAAEWLSSAIARLTAGAVIVIDYGGTMEELEPRRTRGTLRTYRAHHLGPDPLLEPGETDITSDVNFTPLEVVAGEMGAEVELHRQDDYLVAGGLRGELRSLRDRELALARDGDAMQRLALRAERTDAETLLHPRGLGDFRVLVARVTGR